MLKNRPLENPIFPQKCSIFLFDLCKILWAEILFLFVKVQTWSLKRNQTTRGRGCKELQCGIRIIGYFRDFDGNILEIILKLR